MREGTPRLIWTAVAVTLFWMSVGWGFHLTKLNRHRPVPRGYSSVQIRGHDYIRFKHSGFPDQFEHDPECHCLLPKPEN